MKVVATSVTALLCEMAPAFLYGLKSSKHSVHGPLNWLVPPASVLFDLVEEASHFTQLPYLTLAASTTVKIVNRAQEAKYKATELRVLAQLAITVVALLWRSYQASPSSDNWQVETHHMIEGLVTALYKILGLAEERTNRGTLSSLLYHFTDVNLMKRYSDQLQTALFECASHSAVKQVIHPAVSIEQKSNTAEEPVKRNHVDVEPLELETSNGLWEILKMKRLGEDDDRARLVGQLDSWMEREMEEAEIKQLKEALRLRNARRRKEQAGRPNPVGSLEETPTSQRAATHRLREGRQGQPEDAAPPSRRAHFKQQKPSVVEVSSDEEADLRLVEERSGRSDDESDNEARLHPEKALKATKKKTRRAQAPPGDTSSADIWTMGMNPGSSSGCGPPPAQAYAGGYLAYSGGYPPVTYPSAYPPFCGPYPPVYGGGPAFYSGPLMHHPSTLVAGGVYHTLPLPSIGLNSGNESSTSFAKMAEGNDARYVGKRRRRLAGLQSRYVADVGRSSYADDTFEDSQRQIGSSCVFHDA